jgi:hypothetical protein
MTDQDDALSASEEITLRRVDYGIATASEMIARDVERLLEVGLIVRQGPRLCLTQAGRKRVALLPRPDDQLRKLITALSKARR